LNQPHQQEISYSWTISVCIVRLIFPHEEATGSFNCWTTLPVWGGVREELSTPVPKHHDFTKPTVHSATQAAQPVPATRSQPCEQIDFFLIYRVQHLEIDD
jgi:hypothetical protein